MPKNKVISIFTGSFKPPHKGHFNVVKTMLKKTKNKPGGYVYVFISSKEREPCEKITGEKSKEVWKIYLDTLPMKDKSRVKLVLSKLKSPILTAYGFAKQVASSGDIIYLVKSQKNASNSRYSSFKNIGDRKIQFKELVIPGFADMNSTDFRRVISLKQRRKFNWFIPDKLKTKEKNKLWNILVPLCKN